MKHSKIEKFKQEFLKKQKEIIKSQEARVDQLDIGGGAEETDIVQAGIIKSLTDKLFLRDKEALAKIQGALARIESGSFGICTECDEEIAEKRLLALSHSELCIFCAEKEEKLAKSYRK